MRSRSVAALAVLAVGSVLASCSGGSSHSSTSTTAGPPTGSSAAGTAQPAAPGTTSNEAATSPCPTTTAVAHAKLPAAIVVDVGPFSSIEAALDPSASIDSEAAASAATLAYAAAELRDHLALAGIHERLVTGSDAGVPSTATSAIGLGRLHLGLRSALHPADGVDGQRLGDEGYVIASIGGDAYITGNSSVAVLYGVYGFLERLGFAWYDPADTTVPSVDTGSIPSDLVVSVPTVGLRGFWTYLADGQRFDASFARWMARNRLNVAGGVPSRERRLLGIHNWSGVHDLITKAFTEPSLLDAHPDWYAEIGGKRQPASSGVNIAFASDGAADHFAEQLVARLAGGDLADVDLLNVWPVDSSSPGAWDQSAAARAIGNDSDNLLSFIARVAEDLDAARKAGRLDRPVTLAGIGYYQSWVPPTNARVIARLEKLPFVQVLYLNQRSFAGPLTDDRQTTNATIRKGIEAWRSTGLPIGVVEYFNYSVYSSIAVDAMGTLPADVEWLTAPGPTALYGYMHPLLRNPGPRRLTNRLMAALSWDDGSSCSRVQQAQQIEQRYFADRYGRSAAAWAAVSKLMSGSVSNVHELFGTGSLDELLLEEQHWSSPPFSRSDVLAQLNGLVAGGHQRMPDLGAVATDDEADYTGLDASISAQQQAKAAWERARAAERDPAVLARIDDDVAWFSATASRYRLLQAVAAFWRARAADDGVAQDDARSVISAELAALRASPVTADTISVVDQRAPLAAYEQLVGG